VRVARPRLAALGGRLGRHFGAQLRPVAAERGCGRPPAAPGQRRQQRGGPVLVQPRRLALVLLRRRLLRLLLLLPSLLLLLLLLLMLRLLLPLVLLRLLPLLLRSGGRGRAAHGLLRRLLLPGPVVLTRLVAVRALALALVEDVAAEGRRGRRRRRRLLPVGPLSPALGRRPVLAVLVAAPGHGRLSITSQGRTKEWSCLRERVPVLRLPLLLLLPPRLVLLLAQVRLGAARLLGDALGSGVPVRRAQEDGAAEALVDGLLFFREQNGGGE